MALNPVAFTENVISNFLRYQLTAYPFADPGLHGQMRTLLSLEETRRTPLMRGPYVSLSRPFVEGAAVEELVSEGILHPHMPNLIEYPHLYGHQEEAIRAIADDRPTIISTGTGSGKTECFLYPIISKCLELRDEGAPAGISAVIIYPMNALAEDQLGRMRGLLAGTGITFGMYVGPTPETEGDVTGQKLRPGSSKADYLAAVEKAQAQEQSIAIHPPEERCDRETMRTDGKQPRILLTNVKQMELLLTRGKDVTLFDNATLDFLVFDEAHTFRGAEGAETACLIRRLRSFCGRSPEETICIASSATIADPGGDVDPSRKFASRFFGVDPDEVAVVHEVYEPDAEPLAREETPAPEGDIAKLLRDTLAAVDAGEGAGEQVAAVCEKLAGKRLDPVNWEDGLFRILASTEMVYSLRDVLQRPQPMAELVDILGRRLKRNVTEEEVLIWLALGAAARDGDRPLLRPVVHGFVRGISGATVTFPPDEDAPKLRLITPDEADKATDEDANPLRALPVLTCTTCGQHYFEHHLEDFEFTGKAPGGGEMVPGTVRRFWKPRDGTQGGDRLLFMDHLVGAEDDEDDPSSTAEVFLCRYCGALHPNRNDRCDECGRPESLVRLMVVQGASQDEDQRGSTPPPGMLTSCVSCKRPGGLVNGQYREPIRRVRATTVADIHVLAQEMIRHSERPRLLVFADNRQDAAFQAGWMKDHARRFRLRSLMWDKIKEGPISIGDLVAHLDRVLDEDNDLSQALLPEVWSFQRKAGAANTHAQERRRYLRMQVLLEVTMRQRQRLGLEPWGRMRLEYDPLDENDPWIKEKANWIGIEPEKLLDGVCTLLDITRRRQHVYDPEGEIFTHFWQEGDLEIERGYLPMLKGVPQGVKLRRDAANNDKRISQWISDRGVTTAEEVVNAWGVPSENVDAFLEELWQHLLDLEILTPVILKGSKGSALRNTRGAHQLNADRLVLVPQNSTWQCRRCRRVFARPNPSNRCPAYHCDGTISEKQRDPDDYDLSLLESDFQMLRAREHSAQVPTEERDILERLFKGETDMVNTLVCTPTLELGVDIGGLDATLMRNVPPLPANYWQRAGRAGRRHRMAVNITYARPVSHDQFFFEEPMRLLAGIVEPPNFYLSNEIMVRKHVHSTVLTGLNRLARSDSELPEDERAFVAETFEEVFPSTITHYLFDETGDVRPGPYDVTRLRTLLSLHEENLTEQAVDTFQPGWPEEDWDVVTEDELERCVKEMPERLGEVTAALKKRLDWARRQIDRLNETRRGKGTLEPQDDALWHRCDRLIKRFKGQFKRSKGDPQGYDDIYTYGVLSAEGFLPGYGLETGSILGTASLPKHIIGPKEFFLPRSPALALREYVPGNLIYVNGHRFVARYFHLNRETDTGKPLIMQIDPGREVVTEIGTGDDATSDAVSLSGGQVQAVPISDVDLAHSSHIKDDEDFRFQLPVSVYGKELDRHDGGKGYSWGERELLLRKAVHLRLVNVGPRSSIDRGEFGYPVCLVCGQSVSPLSSKAQRDDFEKGHRERCGRRVEPVAFYTDVFADALSLPGCSDRNEAYSTLEALRIGASRVLEMEREDLEVLVIGSPESDEVDAILYDPMPGGSGLLVEMCSRFDEVVAAAMDAVSNCPAECERSCSDCLCTFRNAYYHRHLDRFLAQKLLTEGGPEIDFSHDFPAKRPEPIAPPDQTPVNVAEDKLRGMLDRAGFPQPQWQHQLNLRGYKDTTTPDAFYEGEDELAPGICIYLDGLSGHIHGNPETQEKDQRIREELRAKYYDVLSISAHDLGDRKAMQAKFFTLGRLLIDRDKAEEVRDNPEWFDHEDDSEND